MILANGFAGEKLTAGPKIRCSEAVYDFGTAETGAVVSHVFKLKNVGDQALTIKKIHAPCGCTTAEMGERVIPAGGSAEIAAKLNLSGRKGVMKKSLYVESDDPSQRTLVLTFQGTAGAALEVEPPFLVVRHGGSGEETGGQVIIRDPLGTPFKILGVKSSSGHLGLETSGGNSTWTIRAALSGELPPGQHADKVILDTDHPTKKLLVVDALILVSATVSVAPPELDLPAGREDSELSRTFILRGKDTKGLTIDSVQLPEGGMKSKVEPAGESTFRITITNIRPEATLNGQSIRIHTGGSEPRVLEIPISIGPEADGN